MALLLVTRRRCAQEMAVEELVYERIGCSLTMCTLDEQESDLQSPFDDAGHDALILPLSAAQCPFYGAVLVMQANHHTQQRTSHRDCSCCLVGFDDYERLCADSTLKRGSFISVLILSTRLRALVSRH